MRKPILELLFIYFLFVVFNSHQGSGEGLKLESGPRSKRTLGTSNYTSKELDSIVEKSGLGKSHFGMYVEGIWNLNADKKMIPASITKLVTGAITLVHFPPGTKFKTQLLTKAPQEGNVLKGDLILKGGGDPSFVAENMWFLVNAFVRTEIKKIEGQIIVDDSLFDSMRFDPSRQKERVDRAYDAPTGAMSFNWNSVNVFIRPGPRVGSLAKVFIDPENDYLHLEGDVKTVESGKSQNIEVGREENITVHGQVPVGSSEVVVFKNITNPDLWSGFNLRSFLRQRGIEVVGKIVRGLSPSEARVLAESESKPVEDILKDMNKFSNNYVAEMLTKLVASKYKTPGTISDGMQYAKSYLMGLGFRESQDFHLENPSGLTRKNFIKPLVLGGVLEDMRTQYQYESEFASSLPIAGVDGTLKKRFKGGIGERWVRAKTGYLTGVVSLAGYMGGRDGSVKSFVFMYNGSSDGNKVRSLFDRIVLKILDSSHSSGTKLSRAKSSNSLSDLKTFNTVDSVNTVTTVKGKNYSRLIELPKEGGHEFIKNDDPESSYRGNEKHPPEDNLRENSNSEDLGE